MYGNFLKISRQMESVKVFSTWRHLSLFFLKWFLLLFSAAEMSSFSCLAFYGLCCRRGRWKDGLNTSCSPAIQIMDQLSIKRAPKKPLELNAYDVQARVLFKARKMLCFPFFLGFDWRTEKCNLSWKYFPNEIMSLESVKANIQILIGGIYIF